MTPEELAAIEARANAATPGPWEIEHWDDKFRIHTPAGVDTIAEGGGTGDWDEVDRYNAALIASCRSDIPTLLAEVRRLQVLIAEVAGAAEAHYDNSNSMSSPVAICNRLEEALAMVEQETLPARYSTEAVDALVPLLTEHLVDLFTSHLQSGADQTVLPAELKEMDEALVAVRASRSPQR